MNRLRNLRLVLIKKLQTYIFKFF